jgi:hypothetical protein
VLDAGHPDPVGIRLERYKALSGKGDILAANNEIEALARLDEAELGPYAGPIWLRWGERLLAKSQVRQGRERIQQARARRLDQADDAFALAMLARTVPECERHLRTALQFDPFHQEAHRFYFTTLLVLGRRQEAIQQAEVYRRLYPHERNVALASAVVAALDGKVAEANAILDQWQKTWGADQVRDFKEKLPAAVRLAATVMDNWDEPLGEAERKQVLEFALSSAAMIGNEGGVLFQFPPAWVELFPQLPNKDATLLQRLAQLTKQPPVERVLEIAPEGFALFLDGLNYGVDTEAGAVKMEAAMR